MHSTRAYSLDLRERVLSGFQSGKTFAELGRLFDVSAEWVRQFIRRYEATGEIAARSSRNKRKPLHERHGDALRQAIADNPSHTLESLKAKLGLTETIPAIWYALKALKISFKKNTRSRRAETPRRRRKTKTV